MKRIIVCIFLLIITNLLYSQQGIEEKYKSVKYKLSVEIEYPKEKISKILEKISKFGGIKVRLDKDVEDKEEFFFFGKGQDMESVVEELEERFNLEKEFVGNGIVLKNKIILPHKKLPEILEYVSKSSGLKITIDKDVEDKAYNLNFYKREDIGDVLETSKEELIKTGVYEKIQFTDSVFEKAVRDQLRKPLGEIYIDDLEKIEELTILPDRNNLDLLEYKFENIDMIKYFINLKKLSIYDGKFTNISSLKNLKKLKYLFIINSEEIEDIFPLKELKELEYLEIRGNGEIKKNTKVLSELKKLKLLKFRYNPDDIFPNLNSLTNLEYLEVRCVIENNLPERRFNISTGEGIELPVKYEVDVENISKLKKLELLNLENIKLKNTFYLSKLKNIKKLKMRRCNIDDIVYLAGLKRLEYLDLSFNSISDIRVIPKCKKLRAIDLTGNRIKEIKYFKNFEDLLIVCLYFNPLQNIKSLSEPKRSIRVKIHKEYDLLGEEAKEYINSNEREFGIDNSDAITNYEDSYKLENKIKEEINYDR